MKKIRDCLDRFLRFSLIIGILAMVVLILLQVAVRLLGITAAWTEELTRYIFIWITFLGISSGFRDREHTRLTLLTRKLNKRVELGINLIGNLVFLIAMAYLGSKFLYQTYLSREIAYSIQIPIYLIALSVPLSFLLSIIGLIISNLYESREEESG